MLYYKVYAEKHLKCQTIWIIDQALVGPALDPYCLQMLSKIDKLIERKCLCFVTEYLEGTVVLTVLKQTFSIK